MDRRVRYYVDLLQQGLTPNVPPHLREDVFALLTEQQVAAYMERERASR